MKWRLLLILTIFLSICFYNYKNPLSITSIDTIKFSDNYSKESIRIPAAFTTIEGNIEGEYRINGQTLGSPKLKERISICANKGIIIDQKWHSDNGFQQLILVKNSKARTFKDIRKCYRRALVYHNSSYFIIESTYPMTLTKFAKLLLPYSTQAVNLDMGDYSFAKINNKISNLWAIYNYKKQSNWIITY